MQPAEREEALNGGGAGSAPRISFRSRAPLAFIFVVLFALIVEPVMIGARTRAIRNQVTALIDPARMAADSVEIALSRGVAATRGFLLTREPRFRAELDSAAEDRDRALRSLGMHVAPLGDSLHAIVGSLRGSVDEWEQRSAALVGSPTALAIGARLDPQDSSYHRALVTADDLEERLGRLLQQKRDAIRSTDRVGMILQLTLVILGVLAAVMIGLLDRRAARLVIENQERSRRLERQAEELARQSAERERLLASEREARREADAANRAKSEFLASMSHELRTPLNAISGYVELILLGIRGPVTDQQREDLRRVQRSQHTLLSLINDLLNFAKLDAGQVELQREVVPIDALCQELEPLVRLQLQAKGLRFECAPVAARQAMIGDPDKIEQIMLNLLTNAIKFTPAGGRIAIRSDTGDGMARLHVSDTGRGIPQHRQAEIFDPFVQVDRHLTEERERGVGLGLAISRDLARKMGGDLTVQSEEGGGSVFTLSLPIAEAA